MKQINTHQAKTHLSRLLAAIEERGESFVICRNGRPVAELRPLGTHVHRLVEDPRLSGVRFVGDPAAPLDPEDWPGAELP